MKENLIVDKTYDFTIKIVLLSKKLYAQNEYVLSKQILKSCTSIGANVEEAIEGISKKILEQKCQYHIKKLEKLTIG